MLIIFNSKSSELCGKNVAKVFYNITSVISENGQASVGYSVAVFDTPAHESFSSDCRLVPGLTGLQTSMLIASKVLQDAIGRGHVVTVSDVVSLTPVQ